MPKNKGKGGKNRRRGKNEGEEKREIQVKEEGQEYAQITKILGGCNFEAQCFDKVVRTCHARGKMRKRVWINLQDIVLISLRDFQDGKADVIVRYTAEEARRLKAMGELPSTTAINEATSADNEDEACTFDFDEI